MSERLTGAPLLRVEDLVVEFDTLSGPVRAVDGVTFEVGPGETIGIVGESGCGKTATATALLRLLPQPPARIVSGRVITQDGTDLLKVSESRARRIRGRRIAMIFQDALTSLNPSMRVGTQIAEAITIHRDLKGMDVHRRVLDLLSSVGIPDPAEAVRRYPHELSGGMRQRAMVAAAVANNPDVLIADEPTTALDVTIQAQVLELLRSRVEDAGTSLILISHDLGVIAELVDRVLVMYAGRIVEDAPTSELFTRPHHPYTLGLLRSLPQFGKRKGRLVSIPGQPPDLSDPPSGCRFHPRCPVRQGRQICVDTTPPLTPTQIGRSAACHFSSEVPAPGWDGNEEDASFHEPR